MKKLTQPSSEVLATKLSQRPVARSQRPRVAMRRIARKGRSAYSQGRSAFPTVASF